jgi:hypothetical protein
MNAAVVYIASLGTLYASHQVADHVLGQTDRQACGKAAPGWCGWRANLAHIAAYHLVLAVMYAVTAVVVDLPVHPLGLAAGFAFSAVTHGLLDRRWPVRWVLDHTGSAPFARLASGGLNGMYLADQALHYTCLWLAALIIARPVPGLFTTGCVAVSFTGWVLAVRTVERQREDVR